jgi:hypothetical protein
MVDIPALLQVRDISTNEAWQDAMHLSVPVLAMLDAEGQEVSQPHRAQHGQRVLFVHTASLEGCSTGRGCCSCTRPAMNGAAQAWGVAQQQRWK